MKIINVLSLGVGVQSSAIALMFERKILTKYKPDFAIFADTQREPDDVYDYLEYLKKEIKSFPIYIASKGDLGLNPSKIPFFILNEDGTKGMGWRQCTNDYKIQVVNKKMREVLGYAPRKRIKEHINMIIGISTDEIQRVREAKEKWKTNVYPLLESEISREACFEFFKKQKLKIPARSACYFCPYRAAHSWYKMKKDQPNEFKKAVEYDDWLRNTGGYTNYRGQQFVHQKCIPLKEIDFSGFVLLDKQQEMQFGMNNECEGMCGL